MRSTPDDTSQTRWHTDKARIRTTIHTGSKKTHPDNSFFATGNPQEPVENSVIFPRKNRSEKRNGRRQLRPLRFVFKRWQFREIYTCTSTFPDAGFSRMCFVSAENVGFLLSDVETDEGNMSTIWWLMNREVVVNVNNRGTMGFVLSSFWYFVSCYDYFDVELLWSPIIFMYGWFYVPVFGFRILVSVQNF